MSTLAKLKKIQDERVEVVPNSSKGLYCSEDSYEEEVEYVEVDEYGDICPSEDFRTYRTLEDFIDGKVDCVREYKEYYRLHKLHKKIFSEKFRPTDHDIKVIRKKSGNLYYVDGKKVTAEIYMKILNLLKY